MSLLFNMQSRLVITFLPRSECLLISWLQSPSAVILEPRKIKSATVSTVFPSICHEVMGPVHFLGKTLLAFALLHSVFQGQIWLLHQVFLDFLLFLPSPLWYKGHLFWVLVLEGLVGLHRIIQLQLFQHWCLGYRFGLLLNGLPWKQTEIILSFLRLHPNTAFQTLCWLWGLLHFF